MDEKSIFSKALELEDQQARSEWLDKACGDDKQLRDRVQALLELHGEAAAAKRT